MDICEPVKAVTDIPTPLPTAEIRTRLQAAVDDAKDKKRRGVKTKRVGVLTADERDTWTVVRCFADMPSGCVILLVPREGVKS